MVNRIQTPKASGRPIREDDIQNGEKISRLELTLKTNKEEYRWSYVKSRKGWKEEPNIKSPHRDSILVIRQELDKLVEKHRKKTLFMTFEKYMEIIDKLSENPLYIQYIKLLMEQNIKSNPKENPESNLGQVIELAQKIHEEFQNKNEKINIPLFVYYPVNRSVIDIPLKIRTRHKFELFSAYDESLTSAGNFRTFFEWFREREDIENEDKENLPDPQLDAVRRAIETFMPGFTKLRVRKKPNLRMEVCKNEKIIIVNQLSDGEKCLLALIGDLARRLAIANPMRKNPLEGEGVVMIDELDLHLHPAWQILAIPGIKETFPNLQFLISTHSPHIITHLKPENLFILEQDEKNDLQISKPSESYGKTAERILEDLMGLETTRPTEIQEAFKKIYETLDRGALKDARDSIDKLRDLIGDDPEITYADNSLHYAEFRQKQK